MKPRKSFFAAIAEVLYKLDHQRLLDWHIPVVVFICQFFTSMHGILLCLRCLQAASA